LEDGVALTVNTAAPGMFVAFDSTLFLNSDGTSAVTVDTQGDLALGYVHDGNNSGGVTLTKTGPAALILNQENPDPLWGEYLTIEAQEGNVVLVGDAAGGDPLSNGTVAISNSDAGLHLASAGADDATVTLPTRINIDASTTMTLGRVPYFGEATGAGVSLSGDLTIADGAVLTVETTGGYTLDLAGSVVAESNDFAPDLILPTGAIVTVSQPFALGQKLDIEVQEGACLNLTGTAPVLPTGGHSVHVLAGAALGGDLTNAVYSGTPNVTLDGGAVLFPGRGQHGRHLHRPR